MYSQRLIGKLLWLRSSARFKSWAQLAGFSSDVYAGNAAVLPELQPKGFCNLCQQRLLHISLASGAAKAKNTKRKIIKPILLSKKANAAILVNIYPSMTVQELADALGRDVDHVFEALCYVKNGDKYSEENSVIDDITVIRDVVKKSGFRSVTVSPPGKEAKVRENKDVVRQPPADPAALQPRPPVVTIMGHVDHGKTTLLDALRNTRVVDEEFGGITQHIGAFSVKLQSGDVITFLDTPGHAAFSAMRARGAKVTDIVILVVAADDGVMQQTVESIEHAKKAGVPIIVAINKIDKHEANLERTKRMLLEHEIVLEELGGDVQAIPISALKGTNLQLLTEAVVTQAEVMELKADPDGLVEGYVIEARTDPNRGKLATIIVQRGTLRRGCCLVAGLAMAKVRGMFNDKGQPVQEAPPAAPVEIIGWKEVLPSAGDEVLEVESESHMREVIDWRTAVDHEEKLEGDLTIIKEMRDQHHKEHHEALIKRFESGFKTPPRKKKEKEAVIIHHGPQLSLVIKGDVDGSVEAILDVLDSYKSKLCRLDLLHYGVGNVTENDVLLAESFRGEIFGFNVQVPSNISKLAEEKNIPIHLHNVIYKLFDGLRSSLNKKLPMIEEEEILGEAEVMQVFSVKEKKDILVAGCRCTKGVLYKKKKIKVQRGSYIIYSGPVSSLKHFKNEVASIKKDMECGLSVEDSSVVFRPGDIITCYELNEMEQEIDWDPGF